MSIPIAAPTHLSPAAYLAWERKAAFKNEYLNGVILAMSGASEAHNRITVNMILRLGNLLDDLEYSLYVGDLRVRAGAADAYLYPDVVIVRGKPRFEDDVFDTLLNPAIVIEVLSPSTEARDRGEKFAQYRQLESLHEYILISQESVHVEHYLRQGTQWLLTEFRDSDDMLPIVAADCELPLQHIYRLVEFPDTSENQ